ncbi:MAG TPA: peroxiredoxin [Bacteroidetes bacterium]|nr:peroxiredoxin [Bacteroidota bacterium]
MTVPSSRLHELEERFRSLETLIEESPVKEAISILHGLLHETRELVPDRVPYTTGDGIMAVPVVDLYRQAPKMEGEAQNMPLLPGTPAPEFSLPDSMGNLISLSDYRGKDVMLVFYPLDWSPGCSQQLDLYQSELSEFEQKGIQLLGISVDSLYTHGAWAATRGITFPLLSDFEPKGETAKKYHVYREKDGFSERALFLIDKNGIIRYSYVSPFLEHVPDIYQLLEKLAEAETLG